MPAAAEPARTDHCQACRAAVSQQARFCPMCGAAMGGAAVGMRKGIVILFADLVGSTALGEQLDPELLQAILGRYFAACSACVLEHGGLVEKFIGDAIMAVFGVPLAHEDDALRAMRAALGLLAAVAGLNDDLDAGHGVRLDVRIGICAGEAAVTWFGNGDFRVIGDAVNTASRLQSAAAPGRVLVCDRAAQQARRRAQLEPAGPILVKGKTAPVPAWHLISAGEPGDIDAGTAPAPFVGRRSELAVLLRSYQHTARHRHCSLVTVLGVPGIGKSRLVAEFLDQIGNDRPLAVSGHCRAYGRGATFRPVVEILSSFACGQVTARHALAAVPHGERAWQCLDALDRTADAVDIDEISWAVGTLLAAVAQRSPLVVIWDDLQWAEPTLLDLIEKSACWLGDATALIICLARPEFGDQRPSWGQDWASAVTLELDPLSGQETADLVGALSAGGEVTAQEQTDAWIRVARAAEGNPLFAELMLDIGSDEHGQEIPPSITALLSARLDQLSADERALVERCATIGRYFTWEQIGVLLDAANPVSAGLSEPMQRLIRRRFLQRESASGTYSFTHAMIRDTAYAMTPKSRRENWHLRIADWLVRRDGPAGAGQGSDILAYHLEAASLIRRNLAPAQAGTAELAARAARAVIGQGALALGRRDLPAAANLLERGRELLPAGAPEHGALALRISDCWLGLGEPDRALSALDEAARLAAPGPAGAAPGPAGAAPGPAGAGLAGAGLGLAGAGLEIQRELVSLRCGRSAPDLAAAAAARLAGSLGTASGHELARCRLAYLEALLHVGAERLAAAEQALAAALPQARAIDDGYEEERLLSGLCELALWSRTPAAAGLARCEEMTARFGARRPLLVPTLLTKAGLLALAGQGEQADAILEVALADIEEMRLKLSAAIATQVSGLVRFLAGRFAAAEADFSRGADELLAAGQARGACTLSAYAARSIFEQGRADAAGALVSGIPAEAVAGDLRTSLVTGTLRARIASVSGQHERAVRVAQETAGLASQTDDLWLRGDVLWDQARVLAAAGLMAAAVTAGAAARDQYRAKEAHLLSGRVERWLADLGLDRP